MKVIFYEVRSPQEKKEYICLQTAKWVNKGEKVLFIVENPPAMRYLDQLLWSYPVESFLPHVAGVEPTKERVAILFAHQPRWKEATIVFNLQQEPIPITCTTIEFMDKSDPAKEQWSTKRFEHYKSLQLNPEIR